MKGFFREFFGILGPILVVLMPVVAIFVGPPLLREGLQTIASPDTDVRLASLKIGLGTMLPIGGILIFFYLYLVRPLKEEIEKLREALESKKDRSGEGKDHP